MIVRIPGNSIAERNCSFINLITACSDDGYWMSDSDITAAQRLPDEPFNVSRETLRGEEKRAARRMTGKNR